MKAETVQLNNHINTLIEQLAKKLHTSKIAILEAAINDYAQKKITSSSLAELAGTINKNDADLMIKEINTSKRSRKKRINL